MEFERNAKKDFSRIGLAFVCLLVATTVVQLIVIGILGVMKIKYPGWMAIPINMLPMYLVGVPICFMIMRKIPVQPQVDTEKWGLGKVLLCFVMATGMMYLGNIVSQVLMAVINLLTGNTGVNPLADILLDSNLFITILFVVILAPVIEELVFRKWLLDRISIYGDWVAVFVSGLTFGLFHGNLYQFIYAFLLGMVFAYVYLKTRKVGYCIGLHMAINFMGSVIAPTLVSGIDMDHLAVTDPAQLTELVWQVLPLLVYGLFMIGCMIAAIVLLICLRKKIVFTPGSVVIEKGQRFSTIIVNVGMILYLVGCAAMFVISLL